MNYPSLYSLFWLLCSVQVFFVLITSSFAQGPGCPDINAGSDVNITCGSCTTLTATAFHAGQTNSYAVDSIPYTPFQYNTGDSIIMGIDDIWSGTISIPFNFYFFGNSYYKLQVGSNGLITFNFATTGSFCPWDLTMADTIPTTSLPTNSIMFPYQDIDPTYQGTIKWRVTGTAPARVFISSFYKVPYYGDPNSVSTLSCDSPLFATSQIVLYETTNVIEIYIENKEACMGWNGGLAILGIQNDSGTVAYTVPGRNNTVWTASNEAWRFTPNGVSNDTINWYNQTDSSFVASGPAATVCPVKTTNYIAVITDTNCDSIPVIIQDTATVHVLSGFPTYIAQTYITCNGFSDGSAVVYASGGNPPYTYLWSTNDTTSQVTNLTSQIYTVTVTDSIGCITLDSALINELPPVILSLSSTPDSGNANGTATAFASSGMPPYFYLWSTNDTTSSVSGLPSAVYFVTVTDSNGCTTVDSVLVDFYDAISHISPPTPHISIYPNPNDGTFNLRISEFENLKIEKVSVYNLLGEEIYSSPVTSCSTSINLGKAASSVYYAQVVGANGVVTKKVVVE